MPSRKLKAQSMEFAVSIVKLVNELRSGGESAISGRLEDCGIAVGSDIHALQDAVDSAESLALLQSALKGTGETAYWLELLNRAGYLSDLKYQMLDSDCTALRVLILSEIRQIKELAEE